MPRRAFTIIEVLAVAAIVTLLLSLALSKLIAVRESARAVVCTSHARSILDSCIAFRTDHGALPFAWEIVEPMYAQPWSLANRLEIGDVVPRSVWDCPSFKMPEGDPSVYGYIAGRRMLDPRDARRVTNEYDENPSGLPLIYELPTLHFGYGASVAYTDGSVKIVK